MTIASKVGGKERNETKKRGGKKKKKYNRKQSMNEKKRNVHRILKQR